MVLHFIIPLLIVFLSISIIQPSEAQQNVQQQHLTDHKALMNKTWEVFDQLMYKVEKRADKTVYIPHFPPALQQLNNKSVSLQGYIVPINTGRKHNWFLLSVLPVAQCMFCGQNGIPPMAEIMMKNKHKITYSELPVHIRGIVYLNADKDGHTEIQIRDAELIINNN
ncbi:hypothetical protein ACFU8T_05035 [Sphingobacterium spiritivorum]|uniref:DUF3299 domain-containing protein n=1 Tax=Sphingobacterium spiritivorum ATCC 33861 TaxID=525373 RepID=D7VQR0_SPHSI|nr:hypothetical protein [Sphingobacterium spiritivorum]EFK56111.1 hypothetical protein HMPREF0766_13314 [Sphingobacterium spiritivorum ATCC 33861]QQT35771.1 hypothetical protein I6J01_21375 [Sphingobacterium spiritivorum]WQD32492.1 hypothetical protein U0038_13320 [Sphingobacterium spiritivorum]SUJ10162.1 Uncharacterised protein [Sphingobacterium spiritivorum]